jgi:hypothetical protein
MACCFVELPVEAQAPARALRHARRRAGAQLAVLHHLHPTQREVLRVLLGEAERADGAEASLHLAPPPAPHPAGGAESAAGGG